MMDKLRASGLLVEEPVILRWLEARAAKNSETENLYPPMLTTCYGQVTISEHISQTAMLNDELATEQKKELLKELFGFELVNVNAEEGGEHWVIYDNEGDEFYGNKANLQFNFDTLSDFFRYTAHKAESHGYWSCQAAMRKVLGIE